MGKGKGVDAGDRMLVSGGQNIGEEIRDAQTASPTNILQRAVTVEVLNDLAIWDDAQWEGIRSNLSKVSNWPTFPQLFINGELVGGSDIMVELHENGSLQELMDTVEVTT